MPPSEYLLFVGSYATAEMPGIHSFIFDDISGNLNARWSFPGIVNPSFLAIHPNGHWLYAVSETGQQYDGTSGKVWALSLSDQDGYPQTLNYQASGGEWPCHLTIDATGRWLLVSNYGTGSVGVLPILPHGALGALTDLVQHHGRGPNTDRQEGPHAHSTIFTPDHRFVIAADLGIDQLLIYAFDPSSGRLHPHSQVSTRPGAGPRHMVFHPKGQQLYVAHELDNTIAVYDYDAERGKLKMRQLLETLPPGAPENYVADIHYAQTNNQMYISNRGHDSIAVFSGAYASVKRIAVTPCGGRWPRNFAISPNEQFLIVANQYSDEVTVLPVQEEGQMIGKATSRATIPAPSCVQFVPASRRSFSLLFDGVV